MGAVRARDALHHAPSQVGWSTAAILVPLIVLVVEASCAFAWQMVPAGTEYPSSVATATEDTPEGQPKALDWAELEADIEHAPRWLADPYVPEWPNTVAVCAMMKDEHSKDVQEFLEYHRWIGVDSFYLREHGDETSKAVLKVLSPYERAGVLDFDTIGSTAHSLQTQWYNRCSKMAARKHAWVAFIDIDEFIVVLDNAKVVAEQDALKAVLRRSFRYTAAVSLQWVLFGSGGHKTRPPSGQLQGFQRCTGIASKQMKCLGNAFWLHPTATFLPQRTQQCTLRVGGVAVLGNSEPVPMWEAEVLEHSTHSGGRKFRTGAGGGGGGDADADAERPPSARDSGATYMSHLTNEAYAGNRIVSPRYQLAIFHYLTGSEDAFLERKHARAGKIGMTFERMAAAGKAAGKERREVLREFEKEMRMDGESALCKQGAVLAQAMAERRASGEWSPLPQHEGLLFT